MSEQGPYKGKGETVYATRPEQGSAESEKDWPDHTDPEWLKYQYHVLGKTQEEMGEIVGVAKTTIGHHMQKHDITTRDTSEVNRRNTPDKLRDEEWLREQYWDEKNSADVIAERLGVSGNAVRENMRELGVELRPPAEAKALAQRQRNPDKKYNDENWLRHQYVKLGKSPYQIADENGWIPNTVRSALQRHDIKIRGRKAANLYRYKKEKCPSGGGSRELVSSKGIDASWRDLKDRETGCYIQYRDPKWLRNQVELGRTDGEIADACNVECSKAAICEWRNRFGIERD